jgi:hypothetical protein
MQELKYRSEEATPENRNIAPPFALLQLEKLQLTILGDMGSSIYNAPPLFYKPFNKKKKEKEKKKIFALQILNVHEVNKK